jgi:hypothetical protein
MKMILKFIATFFQKTLRGLSLLGLALIWIGLLAAPVQARSTPAPKAEPAAPAAGPSYEEQVMELVNQERWQNGNLPPLKHDVLLDASAETHSVNMAHRDFFAHCDPDTGKSPWVRMTDHGYFWNSAAENIAAGYSSPSAVMSGWMGSSGHRSNILSTGVRELGIGYYHQGDDQPTVRTDKDGNCAPESFSNGPYYRYWTQNFGSRSGVYPVVIDREAYETSSRNVDLYIYAPSGAVDMRFRNESGGWSAWQPYNPDYAWTLSQGNGQKTVSSEVRTANKSYSASDTILLNDPGGSAPPPTPLPFANPLYLPIITR